MSDLDGFEARRGMGCMPVIILAIVLAVLIYLARENGWVR